ncbi:MAG: LmeA family phospholipid-binding protein [Pleurocapsa sp. MO_226.B13]|nr:LmeA family phospholipid-binding protein [Pleurocapsa sp. MO_226.B13]
MEILVYILSGILAIATSVNVVGDKILKNRIESQVNSVDTVAVRIDNAPNHNALGGKVQRVRVATRDLEFSQAIAFKVLELDIDGIDIKLKEWLNEDLVTEIDGVPTLRLRELVEHPVHMATRMILTQEQLDNILQSETINPGLSQRLEDVLNRVSESDTDFTISSFQLDLIDRNRVAVRMKIPDIQGEYGKKNEELDVDLELGIEVIDGKSFELIDQKVFINGEEIEPEHKVLIARPITLEILEQVGIQARVIQWKSDRDELELALAIRANQFAATALLDASELIKAAKLLIEP